MRNNATRLSAALTALLGQAAVEGADEQEIDVGVVEEARAAVAEFEAPTPSLDDLLETWSVFPPGTWENDAGPEDWYAVADDDGIVAYFSTEEAAFRFRMAEINRALNG